MGLTRDSTISFNDICEKGHNLEKIKTPNNTFMCRFCCLKDGKEYDLPKGTIMVICKKCKWEMCQGCHQDLQNRKIYSEERTAMNVALDEGNDTISFIGTCEKGHDLEKFVTPNDTFRCDACSTSRDPWVPLGTIMFTCKKCKWELCHRCHEKQLNQKIYGPELSAYGHGHRL